MSLKLGYLLILGLMPLRPCALAADQISALINEQINGTKVETSIGVDIKSYSLERIVPIQSLEYQYGAQDNETNKTHILRLNLKSPKELVTAGESHRLSQRLHQLAANSQVNDRLYDAHLKVVESLIYTRLDQLLSQRHQEIDRIIEKKLKHMSMTKTSSKQLLGEVLGAQQIQSQAAISKGHLADKIAIGADNASILTETIIARGPDLAQALANSKLPPAESALTLQHKLTESKLDRIDQEVRWADDEKFFSHLDFRRDTENRENSIRLGFNIPFARFDRAKKERENAILSAKEMLLQRELLENQRDSNSQLVEIKTLANALSISKQKLKQVRDLNKKMDQSKDADMRLAINQSLFEIEKELNELALDFFGKYLSYLRNQGLFAENPNANFLDPQWSPLGG